MKSRANGVSLPEIEANGVAIPEGGAIGLSSCIEYTMMVASEPATMVSRNSS